MNPNFATINGKSIDVVRTTDCYGYYRYKLYIDGYPVDMRKKKRVYAISHEVKMWKYEDIFFGTDVCGNLVIGVEDKNETEIVRRQLKNPCNYWLQKGKIENTYCVDRKNW